MTVNTSPIFSHAGKIGSVTVTAANTKSDGDGTIATNIFKAFEADSTDGSYVQRIRWYATATAAATSTTATVARVFISTQASGATTSANTYLIQEIGLPVVVADHSTNPTNYFEIPLGFALPASYTILVTNHAAPASSTAWRAVVFGGDY